MTGPLRELRYAVRVLWKNRTATLVSLITLALAIGATTAIFTIVDALLLRSLPFPDADRLLQVGRQYPDFLGSSVSVPKFIFWRGQTSQVFTDIAAYDTLGSGFNLTGVGTPERLIGSRVSAGFLKVMGVQPVLGRDFREDEDVPGGPKLVMLSHDVWANRFGARTDLIGQAISLNGEPYTVIGVMPDGFRYPDIAQVWTLFQFDRASLSRANYFDVVGRLKPEASLDQARAALQVIAGQFKRALPNQMDERETIGAQPLRERLYGNMRTSLLVLLAAVAFVLLIACVNVANLQLAQAAERRHEIALRTALGANTWTVLRQLLLESVVLALIGGLAGVALAYVGVPALLAMSPVNVPNANAIAVDWRVLGAALGISLFAGLAFGSLPAWQSARTNLDEVLRSGTTRMVGRVGGWTRRTLVAGEVALALMLTIGAFLLVKSLSGLHATHPGFAVEQVLTMKLSLPESKYGRSEALAQFQERVEQQLRALPGVRAAAFAQSLPMEQGVDLPFTIEGKYVPGTDKGVGEGDYRASSTGYFETLQIPLRRGRLFDSRDRRGTLPVAIINETLARRYWPKENPIGQRITVGQPVVPDLADPFAREIVGVVADVRENGLNRDTPGILYIPLAQQNDAMSQLGVRLLPFSAAVRADGGVAGLARAAQQAVWTVDPQQPITDVRLMRELVARSLGAQTFNTVLLGSLAALALLLAAVGLYGVIAHMVAQQTREIGVRMALGATEVGVVTLFLRQAVMLVAVGIVIGLAGAFGMTRFLRALLTGISTTDPWVFALAPALMLVVAIVAALRPTLRAARVDPVRALRAD
jgi:putative ABC transport system permease protein